ncbi:MAG: hypothetical protein V2I39_12240, partial [Erythrobacter sp.]|nr:hypothetical protein [Erythrobacter sp.]
MKKILDGAINAATYLSEARGPVGPAMLRGGRVTKHKGEAASYSPDLGLTVTLEPRAAEGRSAFMRAAASALRWSSAPIAIVASGFAIASPAAAQDDCVATGPDQFACEDNGPRADTTQTLTGGDVVVQIEDGFVVDTQLNGGPALSVDATDSLTIFQLSGTSTLRGQTDGLVARLTGGPGGLSITTGGLVRGVTGRGIEISAFNNAGDVTLDTTAGIVVARARGIGVSNFGQGDTTVTTANVRSEYGRGILIG